MQDKILHMGEVFASCEPVRIRTTLGSCIATCLFDPVAQVGGMNHFMLPEGTKDKGLPARYGVHAMELLITDIMKLGGDRGRLQAKVFGGGHVLPLQKNLMAVPKANIQFVKRFLAVEKMPIRALRVGGDRPLLVHFFPQTGRAFVKPLGPERADMLAEEEARYRVEAVKNVTQSRQGSITLF